MTQTLSHPPAALTQPSDWDICPPANGHEKLSSSHHVLDGIWSTDNFSNISESCAFHQCTYCTKYSRFMKVWKPPSIKTMLFRGLLFGASVMISAAFQYSSWSNVIINGSLCLIARSQIKYKVDKVHVLSPEYRSIIGRNTTDDWPGCSSPWWSIWIIPCHPGVSCLKFSESSQRSSTVLSQCQQVVEHDGLVHVSQSDIQWLRFFLHCKI